MDELFAEHQLIMLPCSPVARLAAGADHSQTRAHLLRYTTPFSLAGVPVAAAGGDPQKAKTLAHQGIIRFPLSSFLREELGSPDLKLLANDSTRILNLAAQYLRLGLYQRALQVLSRNYPRAQPDQSEPGEPSPGGASMPQGGGTVDLSKTNELLRQLVDVVKKQGDVSLPVGGQSVYPVR